jgi:transcriptional activator HAC1
VSVDVSGTGLANGDLGFPFSLQPFPSATLDDKPIDNLFDFESFPDLSSPEPTTGLVDGDVFLSSSLFTHHDVDFDLSDHLDAKHFDLQTAPGATHVSDGAFAAGI